MYANPEPRPVAIEEPPVPELTPGDMKAINPTEHFGVVEMLPKPKRRKSNGVHPESA
jgi:hypothetical protein